MRKYSKLGLGIFVCFVMIFFYVNSKEDMMGTTLEDISMQEESTEIGVEETISVTELDMGDYMEQMTVGEKQLLSVTCLPMDATETSITYTSSNPEVATINGMGRITALAVGTTTITASCQDVSASFELQVGEEEDTTIPVSDIEIGSHESEVKVGETLSISATVVPADATNSTVTYKSSNEAVATVNSTGEVQGISKGTVIIYVTAENITKEVSLTVKVPTTGLSVNNDYLILKKGNTFQLSASVTPAEANQAVTYRSMDEDIATVSDSGLVSAKKVGNTTIMVSNGDSSVAVSVIVNQNAVNAEEDETPADGIVDEKLYAQSVHVSEVEKIDKETLYHLYETQEILKISGDGYMIEIDGKDIVNYQNEFYTDIQLKKEDEGMSFYLNQGEFLCGDVRLYLAEPDGKYLYLYNTSKEKYELIKTDNLEELKLTTPGEYRITDHKLSYNSVMVVYFIVIGAVVLLIGVGVYIVLKKKYWFW